VLFFERLFEKTTEWRFLFWNIFVVLEITVLLRPTDRFLVSKFPPPPDSSGNYSLG